MHAYKMNAHEVYSYEMHAREMQAHKTHVHEMHADKTHAYEMHAHETHAYEIHALEMHARKVLENLQISHPTNGGAVVDLSRSELQNMSFCANGKWSLLPAANIKKRQNLCRRNPRHQSPLLLEPFLINSS
jgi:hypothetical protein